jgi:hypothetical protein
MWRVQCGESAGGGRHGGGVFEAIRAEQQLGADGPQHTLLRCSWLFSCGPPLKLGVRRLRQVPQMADERNQAESEHDVVKTKPDAAPDLPMLSKDAWELVQYRLWDHLRSKVWTTLSVFLTLVTVAGLLGIPAYISSRVDAKIADERAKFDGLRAQIENERMSATSQSDVAAYATIMWLQDLGRFQLALVNVDGALQSVKGLEGGAAYFVRGRLRELGRFEVGAEKFRYSIRLLTEILKQGRLPDSSDISGAASLTEADWSAFREASKVRGVEDLTRVYELYSHVFALRSAALKNYQSVIDPALKEPVRRAKLYEQYAGSLFPLYQRSLGDLYGAGDRPAWLSGGADWSWLSPSAVSAFTEDEKRLAGETRAPSK